MAPRAGGTAPLSCTLVDVGTMLSADLRLPAAWHSGASHTAPLCVGVLSP